MSPYVDGEFREPTNEDRANWAQSGLETYAGITRTGPVEQVIVRDGDEDDREHFEEVASDFVCDLMHLCKQMGVEWDVVAERAEGNFVFEEEEEQ